MGQKAPSTTRCIKTDRRRRPNLFLSVRKHPAPQGALRLAGLDAAHLLSLFVRNHPAPEGALRRDIPPFGCPALRRQKAPSTRRCIKTSWNPATRRVHQSQKAPSTRRCIKTFRAARSPGTRLHVRKHPAPQGALRLLASAVGIAYCIRQKAPSTTRCIKTQCQSPQRQSQTSQKAPSTTRCIKPPPPGSIRRSATVRKHPAPEGALRQPSCLSLSSSSWIVRKHPAPEGALRLLLRVKDLLNILGQKAPNTRRCIKTRCSRPSVAMPDVRKHPAPQGA